MSVSSVVSKRRETDHCATEPRNNTHTCVRAECLCAYAGAYIACADNLNVREKERKRGCVCA